VPTQEVTLSAPIEPETVFAANELSVEWFEGLLQAKEERLITTTDRAELNLKFMCVIPL
jgi:hypothetical protein